MLKGEAKGMGEVCKTRIGGSTALFWLYYCNAGSLSNEFNILILWAVCI